LSIVKRPWGVTAAAIVAILGGIFAFLFVAAALAGPSLAPPPQQAATDPRLMYWGAALFAATGVALIVTAVGLFRLRPWARISILVFATFLAFSGFAAVVAILAVPVPPDISVDTRNAMRIILTVLFSIPLITGIWWLVQFNRPATKAAFLSRETGSPSLVPASVSVIAWITIIGGVFYVVSLIARVPAILFGSILTGWSAGIYYALCVALSLYIGRGLLTLQERARLVAIGWFAFSLLHWGLLMIVPTFRQRMIDVQKTIARNQPDPVPFDQTGMMALMFGSVVIVMLAAIWLLVRNRAAFLRSEVAPV
jgi:hypothetical protein